MMDVFGVGGELIGVGGEGLAAYWKAGLPVGWLER